MIDHNQLMICRPDASGALQLAFEPQFDDEDAPVVRIVLPVGVCAVCGIMLDATCAHVGRLVAERTYPTTMAQIVA